MCCLLQLQQCQDSFSLTQDALTSKSGSKCPSVKRERCWTSLLCQNFLSNMMGPYSSSSSSDSTTEMRHKNLRGGISTPSSSSTVGTPSADTWKLYSSSRRACCSYPSDIKNYLSCFLLTVVFGSFVIFTGAPVSDNTSLSSGTLDFISSTIFTISS